MFELICKNIIILAAIASLFILEYTAIIKGLDGSFFGIVIAAIAGLGGYSANKVVEAVKEIKDRDRRE